MRIVVSGTHASGKSTLISDFALRNPRFEVLPDPFELVDERDDAPAASLFAQQLGIAADRLTAETHGADLIAERGPLDFLAYLLALGELTGAELDDGVHERMRHRTAEALSTIDLLVVLPLTAGDPMRVGSDEHPELRDAMNDALVELIDDPDLVDPSVTVAEITGSPEARVAALEALTRRQAHRASHPPRSDDADVTRR